MFLVRSVAEFEKIEERLISGRGVLKVPVNKTKNRMSVLYLDVVRPPRNAYLNKNWNPNRGRYAFLSFLRDDYVISTASMEFTREAYDTISDGSGQTLIAVKCAYEGILQTFTNLGNALLLPSISYQDLIKDYENLRTGWEEVRIQCYADTAIQARLYRLVYDTCDPTKDQQRKPPPPPPPLPRLPAGTPIGDISNGYDGGDDDGNTVPYDYDDQPYVPPPLPPNTRLKWNLSTNRLPRTTYAQAVFATFTPVSGYSVTGGNQDIGANAKEWIATFISGTTTVNGSAIGNLSPEDKPVLYLWEEGKTDKPWDTLYP